MTNPFLSYRPNVKRALWLALLFLAAWALLAPTTVGAQAPGVSLSAQALYEGSSKYGEWLPVVVDLRNEGTDVRGEVRVNVSGTGNTGTYAQQVELPRGARKRVTLYVVPNNFTRRLTVEFLPAEGEEPLAAEELAVRPVPNIRFVAAAITGGGSGLDALTGINFRGERQNDRAEVVPLTLDTLPDRPEALRTLDLLILTGVDTSDLTPRQRAALEQYVSLGGTLVLGGGPDAGRVLAGIPDSLRPVALAGEVALDELSSLDAFTGEPVRVSGPFPAARGEPVATAAVRLAEGDLPLMVEREVGKGVVVWLALDPALTPFDAWAGVEGLWKGLLGGRAFYPPDLPPDQSARQMINNDLFYALQNLPSLDLPSLRLLVPLLALYILVVGPLNYFLLRRQRRLELAWLTIPVVTILFSVGAYGLGYRLRGSDVILNQVALVQGVPGSEGSAYVRSMIGIFSPSRRSYDFTVRGEPLLSPSQVNFDPFSGAETTSSNAVLYQGDPSLVEGLMVNQWSMQSVLAESLATGGYAFDADLTTADGSVRGTIVNRSAYDWEDVVVVLGRDFVRLGDVARGESVEVELDVSDGNFQGSPDVAWRIFEAQFGATGPDRQVQVRQQMLSSLYNSPFARLNSPVSGPQPVLLAWISAPANEVRMPNNARLSNVATTLLYSDMPVRFGVGAISLPRGMLEGRVVTNDGGICYGPSVTSVTPDFSEAEIQFELPAGVQGLDPSQLSVYVNSDGGWFVAPALFLYDYQGEQWVELVEPVMGRNKITEPDTYVSEQGMIRLRVENPNRNQGGCLFFDASLEGTLGGGAISYVR